MKSRSLTLSTAVTLTAGLQHDGEVLRQAAGEDGHVLLLLGQAVVGGEGDREGDGGAQGDVAAPGGRPAVRPVLELNIRGTAVCDLYGGRDLVVLVLHDVDDVGPVSRENVNMRAGDPLCEGLVDISVDFSHGEDDEEVVLLSHAVDV